MDQHLERCLATDIEFASMKPEVERHSMTCAPAVVDVTMSSSESRYQTPMITRKCTESKNQQCGFEVLTDQLSDL